MAKSAKKGAAKKSGKKTSSKKAEVSFEEQLETAGFSQVPNGDYTRLNERIRMSEVPANAEGQQPTKMVHYDLGDGTPPFSGPQDEFVKKYLS
jgi:hypothetical protein